MTEDVRKKPRLTAEQAENAAAQTFGLFGTASPLAGERDQNFKIETPGGNYVLKIANPEDAVGSPGIGKPGDQDCPCHQ